MRVTGISEKLQCLPGDVEGSTYILKKDWGEPCYVVVLG